MKEFSKNLHAVFPSFEEPNPGFGLSTISPNCDFYSC